jgi:hypothetical protein
MKFVAFDHEYDISNLPMDSSGVVNDLILKLIGGTSSEEPFKLQETQL